MANKIVTQVLGAGPQTFDNLDTVKDARKKLGLASGYAATVNGEPADDDQELEDYEQVMFAPAVKGGK